MQLQSTLLQSPNSMLEVLVTKWCTLKFGILDVLKHPPPYFEDVVKCYFSAKKDLILATAAEWTTEAEETPILNLEELHLDEELANQLSSSSSVELFNEVSTELKLAFAGLSDD